MKKMSAKKPTKRKIPDEYDVLTIKMTQKLKKTVGDDLAAFLLVGSVAHGNYVKGDSDCDFYIVIKKDRDKQVDIIQRIGQVKAEFENDPQYSSILDLMVFFEEDLNESNINASSIVNWIHVWTGQKGVLKIGKENPFEKVEVTEERRKKGATQMCLDNVFIMRDGFLNTPAEDKDILAFYASDALIGCAQALLIFQGEEGFNRYNIPEIFAEKVKLNLNQKILADARDYKLGAKIDNIDAFLENCYDFGWAVLEHMFENQK
jgi:predicted nucleotidyltransferase